MADLIPSPPPGSSRLDKIAFWLIRILIITVPAFVAYFQARDEAASKAKSAAVSATVTAEAGYSELVDAVRQLEVEVKELRLYVGKIQGHVDVLESLALPTSLRILKPAAPAPPEPAPPIDLPDSLHDAAAQQKKN